MSMQRKTTEEHQLTIVQLLILRPTGSYTFLPSCVFSDENPAMTLPISAKVKNKLRRKVTCKLLFIRDAFPHTRCASSFRCVAPVRTSSARPTDEDSFAVWAGVSHDQSHQPDSHVMDELPGCATASRNGCPSPSGRRRDERYNSAASRQLSHNNIVITHNRCYLERYVSAGLWEHWP